MRLLTIKAPLKFVSKVRKRKREKKLLKEKRADAVKRKRPLRRNEEGVPYKILSLENDHTVR